MQEKIKFKNLSIPLKTLVVLGWGYLVWKILLLIVVTAFLIVGTSNIIGS